MGDFVIVKLIFVTLVFSLTINSFKNYKQYIDQITDERNNLCYICQLHRTKFDKQGVDFDDHIKNAHNVWNIIYYIIYLELKDQTEFTGIENQVYEKIWKGDFKWIPF